MYPSGYFSAFSPAREFVKWAAVKVTGFDQVPPGMEVFTLPGSLYAVFHNKGPAHNPAFFQYSHGVQEMPEFDADNYHVILTDICLKLHCHFR